MIRPQVEIADATEDDIVRFYGPIEFQSKWAAKVMRKGKLVAAVGGAFEAEEGVWYAFLEIPAHERRRSIYRHAVKLFEKIKWLGAKQVRATCDTSIPRAREFMERMGFTPTDETIDGKEVWQWQN